MKQEQLTSLATGIKLSLSDCRRMRSHMDTQQNLFHRQNEHIPQGVAADQAEGPANGTCFKVSSLLMVYDISQGKYGLTNHILITLLLPLDWLSVHPVIS